MTYKVRYFLGALFALLAAGLGAIFHSEELLQGSVRALVAVCGAILGPASQCTQLWSLSPTPENSQRMGESSNATSTLSLSAPFDTSMASNQRPDLSFGSWSSSKEEHLTFICSSTSKYHGKLWLNGGSRLLQVKISNTCLQELESKLCTMVATEPSATPRSTQPN